MNWTIERSDLLRTRWAEGLSASQISTEMGDVTRNAVIGRIHRMGLPRRADSPKRTEHGGRIADSSERRITTHGRHRFLRNIPIRKGPTHIIDSEIPIEQRKTLMQLDQRAEFGEYDCHFPIGDGVFLFFCGAPASISSPYCEGHHARCYRPATVRKEARPWRGDR